jgi:uncharacterized membrane protein
MRSSFTAPIVIIFVSIPMIFGLIPRNGFYGFRTPTTLRSDAVWYPANKMAGILFTVAGVIWLLLAIFLPESPNNVIGVGLLFVAVLLSFVYLSKLLIP